MTIGTSFEARRYTVPILDNNKGVIIIIELNKLKQIYENNDIIETAKYFNCTILEIADLLKQNNIKLKNRKDVGVVNKLRQQKPIDKDELYQKFIVENMRRKDVAKYFNCSEALIRKKCAEYGIVKNKKLYLKNTEETLVNKYGTTDLYNTFNDKRKATNIKKYGVEKPFQNIDVQRKVANTRKNNYSDLEQIIADILTEINMEFEHEYFIEDSSDTVCLVYDFAVFNNSELKYFIEVDGIMHELFKEEKQERDMKKDMYAKNKKIPLLRLKHDEFDNIKTLKEKIIKFLNIEK